MISELDTRSKTEGEKGQQLFRLMVVISNSDICVKHRAEYVVGAPAFVFGRRILFIGIRTRTGFWSMKMRELPFDWSD